MRLQRQDRDRLEDLTRELGTLKLHGTDDTIKRVTPAMRELLELENVVLFSLKRSGLGWDFARWNESGLPRALHPAYRKLLLHDESSRVVYVDMSRPVAAHRNRFVDASTWFTEKVPERWEQSTMHAMLAPLGLQHHHHYRSLLCDGPALLGWFGTLFAETPTARQYHLLSQLAPAVRSRLALERQLHAAPLAFVALEAALEQLGAAAMVVDAHGDVREANSAARGLLDGADSSVRTALRDAVTRRPNKLAFQLTELRDCGLGVHWLAILRTDGLALRSAARVRTCATRWTLTPRQVAVLELVVTGMANATIGAMLGIGDRAVELHVTAIFDRAGIESRAALVATVLGD